MSVYERQGRNLLHIQQEEHMALVKGLAGIGQDRCVVRVGKKKDIMVLR